MATVAVSGGIDSLVLMYELAHVGDLHYAVLCNFGQPTFQTQKKIVEYHVKKLRKKGFDVDLVVMNVPLPKDYLAGRPYEAAAPSKPFKSYEEPFSKDWTKEDSEDNFALVPARNSLIALYAGIVASEGEVEPEVHVGFQFEKEQWDVMDDVIGDVTPKFWLRVEALLQVAFDEPVALKTPFIDRKWNKIQIIQHGLKLGVDLEKSHTCEFKKECGKCWQCLQRNRALGVLAKDSIRAELFGKI